MAETRDCEQCDTSFVPRREHARFCSPRCRAGWNRDHMGDLKAGTIALRWSITAMSDTAQRLSRVAVWDRVRAFAAIGEAVWWVTIVDATLVRHHLEAYDAAMAGQTPGRRQLIEQTLAGLRFVRNRIGDEADLAEFIEPAESGPGTGEGDIAGWMWKPVPDPKLASLSPRARSWEMSRYRAYQSQLAGHTVGETFAQAATFLELAVADAPSLTDPSAHVTRLNRRPGQPGLPPISNAQPVTLLSSTRKTTQNKDDLRHAAASLDSARDRVESAIRSLAPRNG